MEIKFHGGDEAAGNVFAVETIAEAGYMLESHVHSHAHMSVLVSGEAEVTIDGKAERLTGYTMVNIPANTKHAVKAITDIVWLCLWAGDLAPRELAEESLKLVPSHE